jgi:hypothetical protein
MTLVSKLMRLKEEIQRATARVGDAPGRPVPLFWTREFSWAAGAEPSEQFASMGNYAPGEVRIHALGVQVEGGTSLTTQNSVLQRSSSGYSVGTNHFDFEWNLRYNSSGAQYGVAGHTDFSPYLASDVFRGERMGSRFDITPLRLGLNESVEIRVRPVYCTDDLAVVVRFQMWGTRTYV